MILYSVYSNKGTYNSMMMFGTQTTSLQKFTTSSLTHAKYTLYSR